MPYRKNLKPLYNDFIQLYKNGSSSKEIANKYGFKFSNSIRQILKKLGHLRNQSESAKLAVKLGKKDFAIQKLILAAKTTNRFNPLKNPGKGDKHPCWIKDRSLVKENRHRFEERDFFKKMFEKKNYTCEISGQKGGKLVVHHLWGVARFPQDRYNPQNGVVITKELHNQFHKEYGLNKFTAQDYFKFKINYYVNQYVPIS